MVTAVLFPQRDRQTPNAAITTKDTGRDTLMCTCNDLVLHARCFCQTLSMRSGTAETYYANTKIKIIYP